MDAIAAPTHRPPPQRLPIVALLTANAVSGVGNTLTALAIPWFVLQTTGSAARTGLVAFAGLLPTILAAFFGGVVVDRLGFKRTSILADLLSGATVTAVPLLYHSVGLPFGALLALVFVGSLLDAPGGTARESLLPDLAGMADMPLERANAASQTVHGLTILLGPPLAGLLVVALGASNVLWLDAATFAVSATLVALAVAAPAPRERADGRYWDEVREGLRFLRSDRVLIAIALTAAAVNFLAAPLFGVVMPVYARTAFGSARDLGLLLASFGAGSLLGSLAFGALGPRLARQPTLLGTFVAIALPFWALAAAPPLVWTVVALAVTGLAAGTLNPLAITIVQERVPTELRGRVFGAFGATVLVAAPLGALLTGALIEAIGLRPLLVCQGIACLAVTLSMLANPAFRDLDRPGPTAPLPDEPSGAAAAG